MKSFLTVILMFSLTTLAYAVDNSATQDTATSQQVAKDLSEFRKQLVGMKKEWDKFVKEVATDTGSMDSGFGANINVDITQTGKDVIVRADLPGMGKDKIEVVLINKESLKISGSRDVMTKEETPGVVRQERMQGSFERVLELPVECMDKGITASYKDGVLEVVIPKAKQEVSEPVKIKVQ